MPVDMFKSEIIWDKNHCIEMAKLKLCRINVVLKWKLKFDNTSQETGWELSVNSIVLWFYYKIISFGIILGELADWVHPKNEWTRFSK